MSPAAEAFPWEKVRAAQMYLYAIKPWWRRFGSRLTVVPIEVPPPPGFPYAATTHTDVSMNIYIDLNFAISAKLSEIAGAIEHDLQMHMRDVWKRLPYASGTKEKYRKICIDLEINSAIQQEVDSLSMAQVKAICQRSEVFTLDSLHRWMVDSPPSILQHAWLPQNLGLPEGLSAESYFGLIDQNPEPEPDPESGSESDEQSEQSDESEPDSSGQEEQSDDAEEERASESQQTGSQDSEPDSSSANTSESSESVSEAQSDSEGASESAADKADDMKATDPVLGWYASNPDIEQYDDGGTQSEPTEWEQEQAKKELAEDIQDASKSVSLQWGNKPGTSSLSWAKMELRRTGIHWTSALRKMVSSSMSSAKVQGAWDLSYSVPNPNQPRVGPILMGLHDYAPNLYVVADVSASMTRFMNTSLSMFKEIVQASTAVYGQSVTWITIDTEVQDVGTSMSLDAATMERWKKGAGGTILGRLMNALRNGTFRWGRRKYPKADVVLILTDGMFFWPWKNEPRAPRSPKFIMCSVTPYEVLSQNEILPKWINPKAGNFIYADPES